jgi:hypothetical protein
MAAFAAKWRGSDLHHHALVVHRVRILPIDDGLAELMGGRRTRER